MKLTANPAALATALKPLAAMSSRASLPVLYCCLLRADTSGLTCTATDLQNRVELSLDAQTATPGSCCVNTGHLLAIASRATGTLSLELHGTILHCEHEGGTDKLAVLEAVEFPPAPQRIGSLQPMEFPVDTLARLIGSVRPCAATDQAKPVLCSVLLETEGGGNVLNSVATDGKAIAVSEQSSELPKFSLMLTTDTADLILKALAGREGTAKLVISEAIVELELPGVRASFALPQGDYPNWRQPLPDYAGKPSLSLNRTDAITALTGASWAIGEGAFSGVRLESTGKLLKLTISRDRDTATREIKAKGPKFTVTLNPRYLITALQCHRADMVQFWSPGAMEAILLKSEDLTHVIMPMRTS